jgi:hypothetical protein
VLSYIYVPLSTLLDFITFVVPDMARITSAIVLTASFLGTLALPQNIPRELKAFGKRNDLPPAEERAQAVVDTFRTAWAGYYKYAFPNDELKPVSNGFSNSRWVSKILIPCYSIADEPLVTRGAPLPLMPSAQPS